MDHEERRGEIQPVFIRASKTNKDQSISVPKKSLYILRATLKDAVKTNFVFFVGANEEWKAKKGVDVLKGGSLAKTGLVSNMSMGEATRLMNLLGW